MGDSYRVLVVEGETDTGEVLKAVLEPRGLRIEKVRQLAAAAQTPPPNLLVIDDDESAAFRGPEDGWEGVPRVVLGSLRVPDSKSDGPGCHFLQKPFQYPELVSAIERLLTKRAA